MNVNQLEGSWNQIKASVREKFSKLTDQDLQQISGKKDVLIAKLQERYGYNREQAQKELDNWLQHQGEMGTPRTHAAGGSSGTSQTGSSHGPSGSEGGKR